MTPLDVTGWLLVALVIWHVSVAPCVFYLLGIARRRTSKVVLFNVERKKVRVTRAQASSYLRDVKNLPDYEQKVVGSSIVKQADRVTSAGEADLLYCLQGFWVGLPWSAHFAMRFTEDGGFHSRVVPIEKALGGGITYALLDIYGGFIIRDVPNDHGAVVIVHYERYAWPAWYPFLQYGMVRKAWRQWHTAGMKVEMEAIRLAMESAAAAGSSRPEADLSCKLKASHLTFAGWVASKWRDRSSYIG